jgi:NADP oxidoreductase coenzyme F420-dependent
MMPYTSLDTASAQEDTVTIGIVGAGNMGRSIATQLAKTGEGVILTDRNPGKAEAVVDEIAGGGVNAAGVSDALASDIVVLALWYPGTTDFTGEHAAKLDGTIVVDISNPLDASWIRLARSCALSALEEPCRPRPWPPDWGSTRGRWPGTSGSSPASRRDDSDRPNRQLAASASQKNGKAKHPRPAARNDTLPLW